MDHQNCAAEAEQSFEKTEQLWEQIQREVDQMMGSRIRPKKRNKGGLGGGSGTRNYTRGSGPEVNLYGTRAAGDVTKVEQIGNSLGIDWEWQQLLNHESRSYAGVERRQDRCDFNRRS